MPNLTEQAIDKLKQSTKYKFVRNRNRFSEDKSNLQQFETLKINPLIVD